MEGPVQSVSFGTHIIADCGVDEGGIYKVTKDIHDSLPGLGIAVAALKGTTPEMIGQNVGIPQHLGLAKLFAEQ